MTRQSDEIEAANARMFDETLVYLSLFDGINIPPSVGQLRKCVLMYPSQMQAISEIDRRFQRGSFDSTDRLASEVAMITSNLVFGGDCKSAKMELMAARELWGQKRTNMAGILMAGRRRGETPIRDSDRLIEIVSIPIDEDGAAFSIDRTVMRWAHSRWWHTDPRMEEDKDKNIQFVLGAGMAVCAQVVRRKSWAVEISYGRSPASISLITDPTGVKESFRLRDARPGAARRDALLHWVSEHWRKSRDDPDVETYVRSFLRGKAEFTWFDMNVGIQIPPTDADKIDAAKKQRIAMRILGTDRRTRT